MLRAAGVAFKRAGPSCATPVRSFRQHRSCDNSVVIIRGAKSVALLEVTTVDSTGEGLSVSVTQLRALLLF